VLPFRSLAIPKTSEERRIAYLNQLAVAVISAVGPMSSHGMLNARAEREEIRLRQEKDAAIQQRMIEERRLMEERMGGNSAETR